MKSAIDDLEPKILETEKQYESLASAEGAEGAEGAESAESAAAARAARVRDKLRREWSELKDNYAQRLEK